MPSHEVVTSMACAGNRRLHSLKLYPDIKGLKWDVGAISNSSWRGVLVRDLLINSGLTEQELEGLKGKHLVATGLD